MPAFSPAMAAKRGAEQLRMVEPDARDDGHLGRVDDVRGVEAAAEAHLQHHDVAAAPRELHERHRDHQLELGGMVARPAMASACSFTSSVASVSSSGEMFAPSTRMRSSNAMR